MKGYGDSATYQSTGYTTALGSIYEIRQLNFDHIPQILHRNIKAFQMVGDKPATA